MDREGGMAYKGEKAGEKWPKRVPRQNQSTL